MTKSLSKAAAEYATDAHGYTDQRYGGYPYSYHLANVVGILVEFGIDDDGILAAAWLHDVLEDCADDSFLADGTIAEDLEERFGTRVYQIVWACTGEGETREERQACINERCRLCPEAVLVKLADRISNVGHSRIQALKLFDRYLDEHDDFCAGMWEAAKALPLDLNRTAHKMLIALNYLVSDYH